MSVMERSRLPRVDRWIARYDLAPRGLSWDGARLLNRRLAVRRRADWVYAGLVAGGVMCLSLFTSSTLIAGDPSAVSLWWLVATEFLVVAAASTKVVLVERLERGIAAELIRRVAAERAVPTWRRIGLSRTANGVLILVVSAAMLAGLVASHTAGYLIATYALLFAATLGTALVLTARELARPAVAVDEGTLRVDDRWRSQALYVALVPLAMLFLPSALLRVGAENSAPGWVTVVNVIGTVAAFAVMALEQLAQAADRRNLRQARARAERWSCL